MTGAVFSAAAVCLIAAILSALLRKNGSELAILLSLAAVLSVSILLSDAAGRIIAFIRQMIQLGGLESELFTPLLKTVAIALVSRISSEICRDAGEGALGTMVEIAGSFGAILVSMPLFEAAWDMLQRLV